MDEVQVKRRLGTIIKVSNDLARAHWATESVWEIRIVSAVASLVSEKDEDFHTYSIPMSVLGKDFTLGRNYDDIRKAVHRLIKKDVEIKGEGNDFRVYSIFAMCGLEKGNLIAGFHPDLKPLFLNLKKRFTMYAARDIMTLPSSYSQKMFMLLKSWAGLPEITIDIEKLHVLLDTPASLLKNFKDFRRRVLEQAQKDITEKTSFFFQWEPVKKQRAVTAIHFIFSVTVAEEKSVIKQKTLENEKKELQVTANRCYYKHLHKEKECAPNERAKKCKYCLEKGLMSRKTKLPKQKMLEI
jgi:plasmid replication initiation protein